MSWPRATVVCVLLLSACPVPPRRTVRAAASRPSVADAGVAKAPAAARRLAPGWLPEGVRPLRYAVDLTVDPRATTFSGEVSIVVRVDRPTRRVHLHARQLEITRVEAQPGAAAGRVSAASGRGAEPSWGERVLSFERPLARGEHTLRLRFRGPFNKRLAGLYRASHAKHHYAYTQFEAADARKAFPCFDEPRFKVSFDLTLRVPRGMRAFANTPKKSDRVVGALRVVRFERTKPLPTYLVAFVVGDIDVVDGGTLRAGPAGKLALRALVPRGKGALAAGSLALTRGLLPVLERYFGRPYPYRKLDLAALVAFGSGAMENAGLITFRESGLLYPAKAASAHQLRRTAGVIAHELAHQWFGNLVTMRWWDDLWLNEAFATWMGVKAVHLYRPSLGSRAALLGWRSWVYDIDALRSARAVRQPVRSVADAEAAFDGLTYVKGASVLNMLEVWSGAAAFKRGVRAYLNEHAFKNATSADLFRALERSTGKPVGRVARTFLDRPGVPLVQAKLVCGKGRAPRVELTQRRYLPLGAPAPTSRGSKAKAPWQIPVCVAYPRGPSRAAIAKACTLLGARRGVLELPTRRCPQWLHPNAQEAGYYHWSLPPEQLSALSAAKNLPSSTVAAIIEKTWLAVAAGRSQPAQVYRLLRRFRGATDRRVVKQIVAVLKRLRRTFELAQPSSAYRRFVRAVLRPSLRKLGSPRRAESATRRLLRAELFEALGLLGQDARVIARASRLARRFIADQSAVSPDLAPVALRVALGSGRIALAKLRALLSSPLPPVRVSAVRALAMVSAEHLRSAVDWLASGVVGTQNAQRVLLALLRRPELQRVLYRMLEKRLPSLLARMPTFGRSSAARLPVALGAVCDAKTRALALALFTKHAIRGSQQALAEGKERSRTCIALRAWAGPQRYR